MVPNLFGGTSFVEDSFSKDWGVEDGSEMIQEHLHLSCTLFLIQCHH